MDIENAYAEACARALVITREKLAALERSGELWKGEESLAQQIDFAMADGVVTHLFPLATEKQRGYLFALIALRRGLIIVVNTKPTTPELDEAIRCVQQHFGRFRKKVWIAFEHENLSSLQSYFINSESL